MYIEGIERTRFIKDSYIDCKEKQPGYVMLASMVKKVRCKNVYIAEEANFKKKLISMSA